MSTRKKKIKIKKKNFIIFIIFIVLIGFSFTKLTTLILNTFDSPKKEIENKTLTKKEKKLQKLNNINKKISYFKMENLDRYISYKNKNKDLSDEQIIKDVNMDLDKKQYEDMHETINLNKINILVNKHNYLKEDYVPENLKSLSSTYALSNMKMVEEAANAFESLSKDASKENYKVIAMSTYRSYEYQVDLYNKYVKSDGKDAADTYSGRPGNSEHQTGLAVDVYNQTETYTNFEKTEEYDWMQENAYKYGFILRFPKDKENETGYEFESWHYRYVGKDIAKYIHKHNITLEEYIATH